LVENLEYVRIYSLDLELILERKTDWRTSQMKKSFTLTVIIALLWATLACRLPFFNRSIETQEVSTESAPTDAPAPAVQQPTQVEEAAPEPTATKSNLEEEEVVEEPQVFSDNGVQITLPPSYELGDVDKDLAILVEGLQALSEEEGQDIQALYDQNKEDLILWGYDTESPQEHMTSLLILKNEEFAGMSLTIISAFANALLGDEVDSINQERLELGGREVLRFLTTAENAGIETAQAIYLFNEAGKLWVVGFFTNQAQIDQRLPGFDAAVASIDILPVE
jgi:hypothetical protein